MYRSFFAASLLLCVSSTSFAQVLYAPVQYQYRTPTGTYLYGGSDSRVHAMAAMRSHCTSYLGVATHDFDGGSRFNEPAPMDAREPVFTVCAPYQDASWFGYTAADARSEAYANSPTYFRKADLLASAIVLPDGARVVVPTAPTVLAAPTVAKTQATSQRGQIIIIPKRLLDRPLKDFEKKPTPVASAR